MNKFAYELGRSLVKAAGEDGDSSLLGNIGAFAGKALDAGDSAFGPEVMRSGLLGAGLGAAGGGLLGAISGPEGRGKRLAHLIKRILQGGAIGGGAGALYGHGQTSGTNDAIRAWLQQQTDPDAQVEDVGDVFSNAERE